MNGTFDGMLTILHEIPPGLVSLKAHELFKILSGPTLIHLPGKKSEPLFVAVLQHGNETTGWDVICELLGRYHEKELPRALSIFIGNVDAARVHQRRLKGQLDFNRMWGEGGQAEHQMAQLIFDEMSQKNVFASVDIHNNTGTNPFYACINRLETEFFHLATLFSRTVVYFIRPRGVQSYKFATLCPSVTIECGLSGLPHGIQETTKFLDACLHLSEHPKHRIAKSDIDLFHTVAIVKVPDGLAFSFNGAKSDINFIDDLDRLNFSELPVDTLLGTFIPEREKGKTTGSESADLETDIKLRIINDHDEDVSELYLSYDNGEIKTAVPLMPSMLTTDCDVIRQDCFFYIMERLAL